MLAHLFQMEVTFSQLINKPNLRHTLMPKEPKSKMPIQQIYYSLKIAEAISKSNTYKKLKANVVNHHVENNKMKMGHEIAQYLKGDKKLDTMTNTFNQASKPDQIQQENQIRHESLKSDLDKIQTKHRASITPDKPTKKR